jgi:hypothetical protein
MTIKNIDDIDNRMTFLGCAIGITFLRRVSEYNTVDNRSNHTLLTDDVSIMIRHQRNMLGNCIGSWQVKLYNININDIASVRFVFRSNKTDQGGRGIYLFLKNESKYEMELIKCVLNWCIISQFKLSEPFLSRRYKNRSKVLRPCMVNTMLKQAADAFGFCQVRDAFTSHSLRIGGATTLMANDIDRSTIQRIGGWSIVESASDSIYELNTPHDESNLWSALSSTPTTNHISTQDIQSIIPFNYRQHKN